MWNYITVYYPTLHIIAAVKLNYLCNGSGWVRDAIYPHGMILVQLQQWDLPYFSQMSSSLTVCWLLFFCFSVISFFLFSISRLLFLPLIILVRSFHRMLQPPPKGRTFQYYNFIYYSRVLSYFCESQRFLSGFIYRQKLRSEQIFRLDGARLLIINGFFSLSLK